LRKESGRSLSITIAAKEFAAVADSAFPVSSNTRISHAAVFWFSAAALTLLATSQDALQSLRDNRQKVRTDFERLVTER
jgi:hypothetical protein